MLQRNQQTGRGTTARPRRLSLLDPIGEAMRDVGGHLGGLARIAWPYYALAAGLGLLATSGGEALATLGHGTAGIVISLGVLACVVRWQRHALLDEPLSGIAPLDARVLRYFLWSVCLCLVAALPVALAGGLGLATGLIQGSSGTDQPLRLGMPGIALLVSAGLVGLYLFARLCLVLPAVSVDNRSLRLRAAWAASRGHGLALLGVLVLLALGLGLLGGVAGLLEAVLRSASDGSTAPMPSAGVVLNHLVDLVTAVLGASVIAAIYRRLVQGPLPRAQEPQEPGGGVEVGT